MWMQFLVALSDRNPRKASRFSGDEWGQRLAPALAEISGKNSRVG